MNRKCLLGCRFEKCNGFLKNTHIQPGVVTSFAAMEQNKRAEVWFTGLDAHLATQAEENRRYPWYYFNEPYGRPIPSKYETLTDVTRESEQRLATATNRSPLQFSVDAY